MWLAGRCELVAEQRKKKETMNTKTYEQIELCRAPAEWRAFFVEFFCRTVPLLDFWVASNAVICK